MTQRRTHETASQFVIRAAWETGHFWSPLCPDGIHVRQEDLAALRPTDSVVVAALRSMSLRDANQYTRHVLAIHGRSPHFDGEIGPALLRLAESPGGRCPVPDYPPPPGVAFQFDDPALQQIVERMKRDAVLFATGRGNWAGCHAIGDYHCAIVRIDSRALPSFLAPLWLQVLRRVQSAYAATGLLFRFADMSKRDVLTGDELPGAAQIELSFVSSSSGWIGLAIVGQGETCSGNIWCRFLNTYKGGSNDDAIVTQWTTLVKHELGHNCGRSHTNGGVMNPSLINDLPAEWAANDPTTLWLRTQFGGVPVPIPGGTPPDPPVTPPVGVQSQLDSLRLHNIVQDVTIQWLVEQVRGTTATRSIS